MRWVTRRNTAVDRIACPWLITGFIDSDAEFLYVDPRDVSRVAREKDAVPYDVEGVQRATLAALMDFGATCARSFACVRAIENRGLRKVRHRPAETRGAERRARCRWYSRIVSQVTIASKAVSPASPIEGAKVIRYS